MKVLESLLRPPHTAFETRLIVYIFPKPVPDLTTVSVAILLPVSPWNTVCLLWKVSAEISGLNLDTRPCCVTLCESLPFSGPQISGQMTLQAPCESDAWGMFV